jgi:hypothetical protein
LSQGGPKTYLYFLLVLELFVPVMIINRLEEFSKNNDTNISAISLSCTGA